METLIFKIIGIVGLVCIITGLLIRRKRWMYELDIIGGICLMIYSIFLQDVIFIILQVAFTMVAVYEFVLTKRKKKESL